VITSDTLQQGITEKDVRELYFSQNNLRDQEKLLGVD